jgi:hypothetical protein
VRTRQEDAGLTLKGLLLVTCAAICILLTLAGRAYATSPVAKESAASRSLAVATTARVRVHSALASHTHALKRCLKHHSKQCSREARVVRQDKQALKNVSRKITQLKDTLSGQGGQGSSTGSAGTGSTGTPVRSTTGSGSTASGPTSSTGSTPTAPTAPSTRTSAPAPTPAPSVPLSDGTFTMGVVSGSGLSFELPIIQKLGAHTARMEFSINTPVSQMVSVIQSYAKAGIRPLLLAGFSGGMPSAAEAQNLASWASEFGPGGSAWQGQSYPAGTAVTDIEFGNETSYTYQYSDNSASAYASRAQTYALRFKEAATSIQAAAPGVGLLAQGDSGGSGPEWVNQMFKAVPNLGQYVAGWTIHPYGPEWQSRIDNMISTTQAAGAPSTIPVYVTEWGLDSDNGRCLEYNFGFNKCMTYEEAASVLSSTVSAMTARYGSRLAALYLFQANDQEPAGTGTNLESHFGALQLNGEAKGSFTTTVESLLSSNS